MSLLSKTISFIGRLRWRLYAIQNPQMKNIKSFGFNTTSPAPQLKELKPFEVDLLSFTKGVQYRPVRSHFQSQLKDTINNIMNTEEVLVKADKTDNLYKIPVDNYRVLVNNNVTKEYKKTDVQSINLVNKEAKVIAEKLEIANRVDIYTNQDAFVTIKDHKVDFPGRVDCRLINPAKSNLGKVSKQILEKAVKTIKLKTLANQWKNSEEVISWFRNIKNKSSKYFFKFDVVSFYPTIKKPLLDHAISWAKQYATLTNEDINIITHARKSFLFLNSQPWKKKSGDDFDVTMGAYDGAEVCELVGLYILHKMESLIDKNHLGLYRDDGLAVVEGSGPEIERLRKEVFKLFKSLGLQVTIDANITRTDFLDLHLDLAKNSYKPFRKDSKPPVYIHKKSNHPPTIKKELPRMIVERVSRLSCSEDVFNKEVKVYQESLKSAGFTENIPYNKPNTSATTKRQRARKITWFNPPYSETVKTNVAARFLSLINKHFNGKDLGKYFNRSTIKVSYSCLPNLDTIIAGHNKQVLKRKIEEKTKKHECNCRAGQTLCPLGGNCLKNDIIYEAKVTSNNTITRYIGQASTTFKERYRNHMLSFNHKTYEHNTTLSKYIWELKNSGIEYEVTWAQRGQAPSYSPSTKSCKLCLMEKTTILMNEGDKNLLNKRGELMSKCRHRAKFLLSGVS